MKFKWIKSLDNKIVSFITNTGSGLTLLWMTLICTLKLSFKKYRVLIKINEIGIQSIPIVSLIALFVSMVLALQTYTELGRFGAQLLVANIVCVSMLRELGPMFTAFIIIGRVGARFTAEIGAMQVTEQVRALKALDINPVSLLVVPRILAMAICMPALVLIADFVGIFIGGYLIAVINMGTDSSAYLAATMSAFEIKDLLNGLLKAEVFGIIIGLIGCFQGFQTKGGTEGVGKFTTKAVVIASTLILVADFILTKFFQLMM